jgi:GNAT superfamily N-acetyltransferase
MTSFRIVVEGERAKDYNFIVPAFNQCWPKQARSETEMRAICEASMCFGVVEPDGRQIAFGRAVTDRLTYSWVCDVMVRADLRRQGIGKLLMRGIMEYPAIRRTWVAISCEAAVEGFYGRLGFKGDRAMTAGPR